MTGKKQLLSDCLNVFVLTQFALVQPVLFRLSRRTVYLEDQGIEPTTVLWLLLVLWLAIPGCLCLIECFAAAISESARVRVHLALLFLLFFAILLPVLKLAEFLPGLMIVALSAALAALAIIAYRRFASARLFVTVAAPAIILFPAQFLWFSPISRYLFPQPEVPAVPETVRNPVSVVVLIFDEFCGTSLMDTKGDIDRVRYPNFAALAETSTWYRNASSVHPRTEMAVPAILTGNYPHGSRPATVAEYPTNLFSVLDSTQQYDFVVFEPYTRLCRPMPEQQKADPTPRARQWSELVATLALVYLDHVYPLDMRFDASFVPMQWNAARQMPPDRPDSRTGVFRYQWNVDRTEQFDQFIDRIEPPGRPALYFAHLVLPHYPWCFLPSGARYLADDGHHLPMLGTSGYETWGSDELSVLHGYQRYLMQVGYADHLLGKLLERLRATDLFDRCVFVVMADHGVSFHAGLSRRLPVAETLADIASIPLFVKLPGQRGGEVSDRNVESIDVLPTIVDVLGLGEPPHTDGHSLLDSTVPDRKKKQFFDDTGTITLDAEFPSKQATLARMLQLFGDGSEPDRLFRLGPSNQLLGRSVQELQVSDRTGLEIVVKEPRSPPANAPVPIVPCYFSGSVKSHEPLRHPVQLAVAVNGTIRAVTRTYTDKKISDRWSALVPEASFGVGSNEVQIFVVESEGEQVTLHAAFDTPLHFVVRELEYRL